jgi:hypothetical protein
MLQPARRSTLAQGEGVDVEDHLVALGAGATDRRTWAGRGLGANAVFDMRAFCDAFLPVFRTGAPMGLELVLRHTATAARLGTVSAEPHGQSPLGQQTQRVGPPLLRCRLERPGLGQPGGNGQVASVLPAIEVLPAAPTLPPEQRVACRLHRPHQKGAHLWIEPSLHDVHAVVVREDGEASGPMPLPLQLLLIGTAQEPPAPDQPLQLGGRDLTGIVEQLAFVLGCGYTGESSDFGEGQLSPRHGRAGQR